MEILTGRYLVLVNQSVEACSESEVNDAEKVLQQGGIQDSLKDMKRVYPNL